MNWLSNLIIERERFLKNFSSSVSKTATTNSY